MTQIPSPNLLAEDIQAIYDEAKDTMSLTDRACSSPSLNEIDQQQTRIEQSQSALETLLNYLNKEKNQLINSIEAVKAMKKDLERQGKRCNRSYWIVKNALPKL